MISKEYFIEVLEKLKLTNDFVFDVNGRIMKLKQTLGGDYADFLEGSGLAIYHDGIVVELLDKIFDTDMVSYWVYELDFGRKYEDGCVQEQDGTIIDISTEEKLYNYLIKDLAKEDR